MNNFRHRIPPTIFLLLCSTIGTAAAAAPDALQRAANHLRAEQIESLEFEAVGTYYQFSQAPGPGLPWPAFEVKDYIATLDFARGAVHSRYARWQKVEPDRLRPAPVEQKLDQYMLDGITWNIAADGSAAAIPANLDERTAEIWTTPQGFIRAAQDHSANVKHTADGDQVTFTLGQYRYEGMIDADGRVVRVRTWMDSPVLGDTPIEWRFAEYRSFNGVPFPSRIERIVGGFPWYELTVSEVRVNTATPFTVPAEISKNPTPSVSQITVTQLAPGILYFTGGSHNSVIIEQEHGIVVVEAPLNEARSLAVIAKIHELIPNKPITHVINTHIHFDHAGGLRTYANEGALIVSAAPNVAYFKEAWQAPRTLNPDRLSLSKREPNFKPYTRKLVLADPERAIEVHEISGSGHSTAFSMIFLPRQKLLVQGDAWTPAPSGAGKTPNPYWVNLYDNIERLALHVERIAPLHGSLQTIDDLRIAIGQKPNAN